MKNILCLLLFLSSFCYGKKVLLPNTMGWEGTADINAKYGLAPGDTGVMKGSYGFIEMTNVNGVTFINDGLVNLTGWNFNNGAKNIKILGNGTAGIKYGFRFSDAANFASRCYATGDIELGWLEVAGNLMGFQIKTDPGVTYPYNYQNVKAHDLYIHNTGQEGIYFGSDALGGAFITGDLRNIITENTGRDGIQTRNGTFVIEDCTVINPGLAGDNNHNHGILIGGNTKNGTIRRCKAVNVPNFGIFVNGYGTLTIECNDIQSGNSALFTKNTEYWEDLQSVGLQNFVVNNNKFTSTKSIEMTNTNANISVGGTVANNKTSGTVSIASGITNSNNNNSVTVVCDSTITPPPVIPPVDAELQTKTLRSNLNFPWDVLWGYDGKLWITERGGKISRLNPTTGATEFSQQISDVVTNNEGGMLGMVQHPDFLNNGYLYVVYNYNKNGVYTEKVVRYEYDPPFNNLGNALINPVTIIDDIQANSVHNGSRLIIIGDKLYITTGDANNTANATNTASKNGKTLRINLDGSIPSDNPIPGNPMWSLGHRNAQGMVVANGIMYQSEHGPNTEDEINIIEKNINYGWPNKPAGSRAPIWNTPNNTLAVCGIDYYNSDSIPQWKHSLLMATLKDATLYNFKLSADGKTVSTPTQYYRGTYGRLRDIAISPDGKVYLITSNGATDKLVEISRKNTVVVPPPVDTIPVPPPTGGLKDTAIFNISNVTNKVFKKLRFTKTSATSESYIIRLANCSNITFDSCEFNGAALIVGLRLENSSSIYVKNCTFNNTASGVYAQDCGNNIQVTDSRFFNMTGPLARGQAVQFNRVNGTGLRINCNYVVNELGKSYPEDVINLCSSSGTANDRIQIKYNYIKGGGPSLTGGGIMTGDCNNSNYALVEGNVLIDPGQYGIAIAGGRFNTIRGNKVYGKQQSFTNVGIYLANYTSGLCDSDTIVNNEIYWINSGGSANPFYDRGNCAGSVISGNILQSQNVGPNMPPPTCVISPPPIENLPPVANAGINQTVVLPSGSSILLTGTGTDPENAVLTFLWVKVSGPASGSIAEPTSSVTGVNGLVAGTYVFTLTVTDVGGLKDTDTTVVTVNPAPVTGPYYITNFKNEFVTLSGQKRLSLTVNWDDGTFTKYERKGALYYINNFKTEMILRDGIRRIRVTVNWSNNTSDIIISK